MNANKFIRYLKIGAVLLLLFVLIFGLGKKSVMAQESASVLYVPLIGITAVPEPLALPGGEGDVTYHYAVKNFLKEFPLTDVTVTDDKCIPVKFIVGDDNNDLKLDYNETWRYACTVKLTKTTLSKATATGVFNNITATHTSYATVVVLSKNPPPLVSIVNTSKIAYPISAGDQITFTYKVTNPGVIPLNDVTVNDNNCSPLSNKLGDTNVNNLLDVDEVWIYTCTKTINETTTNTASVTAYANGLMAIGEATSTIQVAPSEEIPPLFDAEINPGLYTNNNVKIIAWGILSAILMMLTIYFVLNKAHFHKTTKIIDSIKKKKQ